MTTRPVVFPSPHWTALNDESTIWRGIQFAFATPLIILGALWMAFVIALVVLAHGTRGFWPESDADAETNNGNA